MRELTIQSTKLRARALQTGDMQVEPERQRRLGRVSALLIVSQQYRRTCGVDAGVAAARRHALPTKGAMRTPTTSSARSRSTAPSTVSPRPLRPTEAATRATAAGTRHRGSCSACSWRSRSTQYSSALCGARSAHMHIQSWGPPRGGARGPWPPPPDFTRGGHMGGDRVFILVRPILRKVK